MKVRGGWRAAAYVIQALYLVWTIVPFYWMAVSSVKPNREMYTPTPTLWPTRVTWEHYRAVFVDKAFFLHLRNSSIISLTTTLISFVVGAGAAYALARLQFVGRRVFAVSLVLSYLVPNSVLFIPVFALLDSMGLTDTLQGLILANLTMTVPFCAWLLLGYFQTVPRELEDAALVDGCSRVQAFLRVIIPLSLPALAVVALWSFTLAWNEFLYAVTISHSDSSMPLTAALGDMQAEDVFFWGKMMAMSLLMAIPPVAIYFIGQRWVIGGLVMGGLKG